MSLVPYLESVGLSLDDVDEVFISHADVDHCGGNRSLRRLRPSLRFSCGELDRPYVESSGVMLADIYFWSEPCGFGPDSESKERRSS